MADLSMPMVLSGDKPVTQLRQVTVSSDAEIEDVNKLLAEGWRLISIGYHASDTVYVLGHMDEKRRNRPGFISGE